MLAVINGKVLTMAEAGVFETGVVLVEGKIIKAVGPAGGIDVPADAEVYDAAGKIVMPGLVDAHTHVGIYEEIYKEGEDANEYTDPVTPQMRAIDAINPEDEGFHDALAGGVTTVFTGPGSANVIGGESVAMKTWGRVVDEMVIAAPAGLKVAFGENPKRVYGRQKKMPATRMATAALLREALVKARNYQRKLELGRENNEKMPERDLKMETLVKALNREIPLRAHAHRADDIVTAVRIAEEFGLDLVVEHCTEGHKIADFLAARQIPAVCGPLLTNRSKVELKDRDIATAGILHQAGIPVALMTDHPVIPLNYLTVCAALAVKAGLPEEEALKAITINAARICRLDKRVGSLEPGKDADLVIFSGHPFDFRTKVEKVFLDGKPVWP